MFATSSSRRRRTPTRSTPRSRRAAISPRSRRSTRRTRARRTTAASSRSSAGQTVAAFDTTAFLLDNQVSQPIKTEFGYHVIQPISAVKPAKTTPLKDVKAQIKATLLEQRRRGRDHQVDGRHQGYFAKKVSYATGFAPPAAATDGDDHRLRRRCLAGARRGAPRAAGADEAPAPRLPLGSGADGADDRAAHGRGGLRGRRRRDTPATRRSCSTSSATCSSRRTSSRFCSRSKARVTSRRLRGRCTRSSSAAIRTCSATPVADSAGRVRERWEAIKTEQEGRTGVFHDVPEALPGLLHARKVQRRAAAVGLRLARSRRPAREAARRARRARGRARARGPARTRDRARPARVRASSATCSSPSSTSPGSSTSTRSSPCARRARRFVDRVELAEPLAADAGETWAELDLAAQERWYVEAKAQLDLTR